MKLNYAIAALCTFAAGSAVVGQTIDLSGVSSGQTNNQVVQVAEGHMILFTNTDYTGFVTASSDNPIKVSTGTCGGSLEIKVPAVSGSGHCVFTAENGDMWFNHWQATGMTAEGAVTGSWAIVGGTGALAGATGGGSFHSITDQSSGKTENTVEGAILMK